MLNIGQAVLATDLNGNYSNEPATVIGFTTNMYGRKLVKVRFELGDVGVQETVFYPCELTVVSELAAS